MSIERLSLRRRMLATGAAVACAASLVGAFPHSTSAEGQSAQKVADCTLRYPFLSDRWRACSGYVTDGVGSLWLYYKAGNSSADAYPKHHLETRFFPPARDAIEQRVARWPKGINEVDQEVDFVKMIYNGKASPALVETRESWSVRHDGNELLSPVKTKPHIVWHTLCYARQRIWPSINILKQNPEWLVTDNFRNTLRNCAVFAGKLATGQIK